MLIRYNDLRSLVLEALEHELDERAMTHSDVSQDMALLLVEDNKDVSAVLYHAEPMKEGVLRGDDPKKLADNVVAVIYAQGMRNTQFYEVNYVAALKGWGPFIYDVAMSHSPGLMPDRSSVSASARNVWQHYHDRQDITKIELKPPIKLHGDPILDCAYQLTGPGPQTSALQAKHEEVDAETSGELTKLLISSGLRSVQTVFFARQNRHTNYE